MRTTAASATRQAMPAAAAQAVAAGPAAGRRDGAAGFVLLYTTVLGLLAMALWLVAWRGTHDAIRTERFAVARAARAESVVQAAALAVDLLRSGRPPSDPYACTVSVTGATETYACTVVYASAGDEDTWTVECHWSTDEELALLPPMPFGF